MTPWSFIAGLFIGGLAMRWVLLSALRRAALRTRSDEAYASVRTAAIRHLGIHGTLNISQMTRLTDADVLTTIRWLDRLVAEGHLRAHSHGTGTFFTRGH